MKKDLAENIPEVLPNAKIVLTFANGSDRRPNIDSDPTASR